MDIRNFTTPKELLDNPNIIPIMFDLQANLLEKYRDVEDLLEFPVDIQTRQAQVLIKDFIGRIVEELAEAEESRLAFMETALDKHRQNTYEELADALHFILETGLAVGISGTHLNFSSLYEAVADGSEEFTQIGIENYSPLFSFSPIHLWKATYEFMLARNTLKNKPWKQSEMLTDQQRFNKHFLRGFGYTLKACLHLGMSRSDILDVYYRKNQVNLFRIESNY